MIFADREETGSKKLKKANMGAKSNGDDTVLELWLWRVPWLPVHVEDDLLSVRAQDPLAKISSGAITCAPSNHAHIMYEHAILQSMNRQPGNRQPVNRHPVNRQPANRQPMNRQPVNQQTLKVL